MDEPVDKPVTPLLLRIEVARPVIFVPYEAHREMLGAAGVPMAAIIAQVNGHGTVNLCVFDALGRPHSRVNVPFVSPGDDVPESGDYARFTSSVMEAHARSKTQEGLAAMIEETIRARKAQAEQQQGLLFGTGEGHTAENPMFMAFDVHTGVERAATPQEIAEHGLAQKWAKLQQGDIPSIDVNAAMDAFRTGNVDALRAAGIVDAPPLSPPHAEPKPDGEE